MADRGQLPGGRETRRTQCAAYASAALAAACALSLVTAYGMPLLLQVPVTVLAAALPALIAARTWPRLHAGLLYYRWATTLTAVTLCWGLAGVLARDDLSRLWLADRHSLADALAMVAAHLRTTDVQLFALGCLLGHNLRRITANSASLSKPRDLTVGLRPKLSLLIAALCFVFPGPGTPRSTSVFLAGLGMGIVAHYLLRTSFHLRARRGWLRGLSKSASVASPVLRQALAYVEHGRTRKAERLLAHREPGSAEETAVLAYCHIEQGEFSKAIAHIGARLDDDDRDRSVDRYLRCLLARCYEGIGQPRAMLIQTLRAASLDPACVVATVTQAVMDLELSVAGMTSRASLQNHASAIKAALLRARGGQPGPIARAHGLCAGFFLDALGYAHLACGDLDSSETMLLQALEDAPYSASALVHIAELDLLKSRSADQNTARQLERDARARLFLAAKSAQANSWVQRRARNMIVRLAAAASDRPRVDAELDFADEDTGVRSMIRRAPVAASYEAGSSLALAHGSEPAAGTSDLLVRLRAYLANEEPRR
jgi:tetratricopeptide (TPR) repeat protein